MTEREKVKLKEWAEKTVSEALSGCPENCEEWTDEDFSNVRETLRFAMMKKMMDGVLYGV